MISDFEITMLVLYGILILSLIIFCLIMTPWFIDKRFALCLNCKFAKFDQVWEKVMPIKCKKCKSSMDLIEIPSDLRENRIKFRRIINLLVAPPAFSGYLLILYFISEISLYIWLFIVTIIPLSIIIITIGHRLETKTKREIIIWACKKFGK